MRSVTAPVIGLAAPACELRTAAQVDAAGIYLDKLIVSPPAHFAMIRLAPAPTAGQTVTLNRAQITELLQPRLRDTPSLAAINWTGAPLIKITRRTRVIEEAEVKALLTMSLQRNCVKDRGELELRLTRPWTTMTIVDELPTVKLLELPSAGVAPNFIIRFELFAGDESVGNWQVPVQAHVWREVWVARSPHQRGQPVQGADLTKERRDVLLLRDALPSIELDDPALELAENLSAGAPLTTRSLRMRPIIRRGKLADAIVQEGGMVISVRVEVLEDGLRGQTVRVRNLKSRREFRGKVQNEETIQVSL